MIIHWHLACKKKDVSATQQTEKIATQINLSTDYSAWTFPQPVSVDPATLTLTTKVEGFNLASASALLLQFDADLQTDLVYYKMISGDEQQVLEGTVSWPLEVLFNMSEGVQTIEARPCVRQARALDKSEKYRITDPVAKQLSLYCNDKIEKVYFQNYKEKDDSLETLFAQYKQLGIDIKILARQLVEKFRAYKETTPEFNPEKSRLDNLISNILALGEDFYADWVASGEFDDTLKELERAAFSQTNPQFGLAQTNLYRDSIRLALLSIGQIVVSQSEGLNLTDGDEKLPTVEEVKRAKADEAVLKERYKEFGKFFEDNLHKQALLEENLGSAKVVAEDVKVRKEPLTESQKQILTDFGYTKDINKASYKAIIRDLEEIYKLKMEKLVSELASSQKILLEVELNIKSVFLEKGSFESKMLDYNKMIILDKMNPEDPRLKRLEYELYVLSNERLKATTEALEELRTVDLADPTNKAKLEAIINENRLAMETLNYRNMTGGLPPFLTPELGVRLALESNYNEYVKKSINDEQIKRYFENLVDEYLPEAQNNVRTGIAQIKQKYPKLDTEISTPSRAIDTTQPPKVKAKAVDNIRSSHRGKMKAALIIGAGALVAIGVVTLASLGATGALGLSDPMTQLTQIIDETFIEQLMEKKKQQASVLTELVKQASR